MLEADGTPAAKGSEDPAGYSTFYRCAEPRGGGDLQGPVSLGDPIDWDCDGDVEDEVRGVVHGVGSDGGSPEVLRSRNDWKTLVFTGGTRGGLESAAEPLDETGLTYEAWLNTPKDQALALTGPYEVSSPAGTDRLRLPFAVTNTGTQELTVESAVSAGGDWNPEPTTETSVAVPVGDTVEIPAYVQIADDAAAGSTIEVFLTVQSSEADWVTGTSTASVVVGPGLDPAPVGTLTVAPEPVTTEADFTLTGRGFEPHEEVLFTSEADWFDTASVMADASGVATLTESAPDEPVLVTVLAVGTQLPSADPLATTTTTSPVGDALVPRVLTVDLEVQEAPEPSTTRPVPVEVEDEDGTGDSGLLVLLAVVGVVVAAAIAGIWWVRRRRQGAPNQAD